MPVALLWVAATTMVGARAQAVEVFFEVEMQDSMTGEVLGRAVRKGCGESLENNSEVLSEEKMHPQLDLWAQDIANIVKFIKRPYHWFTHDLDENLIISNRL